MDSGEYKTEYPIDVEGINIPTPTKIDSKYIKDQIQSINKSDVLNDFKDYHYYNNYMSDYSLVDGSTFTVGNKSYNPGLFVDEETHKFKPDSPLVDRFIDISRRSGYETLSLQIRNRDLLRFYRRFGFRDVVLKGGMELEVLDL
jgi:hypothetical protein